MSRDEKRGSVTQERTGFTYESGRTFSHKVCPFGKCKMWKISASHI